MQHMFITDIYVQITRSSIVAKNINSGLSADQRPSEPFSHPRSLIGNFVLAQDTMKLAVKAVSSGRFPKWVRIVIHPMELVEGGLTQVEERVLVELAMSCGASKTVVWVGEALGDESVQSKLRGR